jgi:hypothetical protein
VTTFEQKAALESIGCCFTKREDPVTLVDKWYVELDGEIIASSKFMGEAVFQAAKALGD